MDAERLVDAYLVYHRIEGSTPKTIAWHRYSLQRFTSYMKGGHLDLETLAKEHLRHYIIHLQDADLSPHTIATYVRSLRAWLHWLLAEGYVTTDFASMIREPRTGEAPIDTLTPDEVRQLIAVCSSGYNEGRDRAIITLLYDTGLRASELCGLRRQDYEDSPPQVRVYGKGRKYRNVPLGRTAARELRRYLRARKDQHPALFYSTRGGHLHPSTILVMLRRRGELAGGPHVYPHLLRHTFAVQYLRNGGDLFSLQKILGHTTLEMVRHYARLADADVAERHRRHSPGDGL